MSTNYFDALAQSKDPQTYAIIGAAMEVHREMGRGFAEPVYQESLALELVARKIAFQPHMELCVRYKGQPLKCSYRADFVCFGNVLVEIKALGQITGIERAQVINYLKASGFHRGLLINFGARSLQYERLVWG